MQDILQDIVSHTHKLGFITTLKVNADEYTTIESMADDRSVIMTATTHSPVAEFYSTFGMPDLGKLAYHLNNPEYKENANIDVVEAERNGETIPTHIHFENAASYYRRKTKKCKVQRQQLGCGNSTKHGCNCTYETYGRSAQ